MGGGAAQFLAARRPPRPPGISSRLLLAPQPRPRRPASSPLASAAVAAPGAHLQHLAEPPAPAPRRRKRTKKVGITGKYGVRYGSSLRKQVKKIEVSQHSRFTCLFCGKDSVKRTAVGIWKCKACKKVLAGGAYSMNTAQAAQVRSTIRRLREGTDLWSCCSCFYGSPRALPPNTSFVFVHHRILRRGDRRHRPLDAPADPPNAVQQPAREMCVRPIASVCDGCAARAPLLPSYIVVW